MAVARQILAQAAASRADAAAGYRATGKRRTAPVVRATPTPSDGGDTEVTVARPARRATRAPAFESEIPAAHRDGLALTRPAGPSGIASAPRSVRPAAGPAAGALGGPLSGGPPGTGDSSPVPTQIHQSPGGRAHMRGATARPSQGENTSPAPAPPNRPSPAQVASARAGYIAWQMGEAGPSGQADLERVLLRKTAKMGPWYRLYKAYLDRRDEEAEPARARRAPPATVQRPPVDPDRVPEDWDMEAVDDVVIPPPVEPAPAPAPVITVGPADDLDRTVANHGQLRSAYHLAYQLNVDATLVVADEHDLEAVIRGVPLAAPLTRKLVVLNGYDLEAHADVAEAVSARGFEYVRNGLGVDLGACVSDSFRSLMIGLATSETDRYAHGHVVVSTQRLSSFEFDNSAGETMYMGVFHVSAPLDLAQVCVLKFCRSADERTTAVDLLRDVGYDVLASNLGLSLEEYYRLRGGVLVTTEVMMRGNGSPTACTQVTPAVGPARPSASSLSRTRRFVQAILTPLSISYTLAAYYYGLTDSLTPPHYPSPSRAPSGATPDLPPTSSTPTAASAFHPPLALPPLPRAFGGKLSAEVFAELEPYLKDHRDHDAVVVEALGRIEKLPDNLLSSVIIKAHHTIGKRPTEAQRTHHECLASLGRTFMGKADVAAISEVFEIVYPSCQRVMARGVVGVVGPTTLHFVKNEKAVDRALRVPTLLGRLVGTPFGFFTKSYSSK